MARLVENSSNGTTTLSIIYPDGKQRLLKPGEFNGNNFQDSDEIRTGFQIAARRSQSLPIAIGAAGSWPRLPDSLKAAILAIVATRRAIVSQPIFRPRRGRGA